MHKLLQFFRKDSIYFYASTIIAVTLFLPQYIINSISIIALITLWVINGSYKKINNVLKNEVIIIFMLLYLSFIIGTLYSNNINDALKLLKLRLPILLLPILYSTTKRFTHKETKLFKIIFIGAALIACMFCHASLLFAWAKTGDSFSELIRSHKYSYTYITNVIDLQPTYFSYLLIICLIFLESTISKTKAVKTKILYIIISIYFILFLIHITSRIALLVLVFGFLFYLTHNLFKKNYKAFFITFFILISGVIASTQFEFTVKRYKQVANIFIPQKGVVHKNSGYRVFSFKAFKSNFKEHPFFGEGLADGQEELDNYFDEIGFPHMKGVDYHNQYIQTTVELGVIGLIIFLLTLLIPLRMSIIQKNKEFFLFLMVTIMFLAVENMFIRHKGVVPYALFNALFLFGFLKKENLNE